MLQQQSESKTRFSPGESTNTTSSNRTTSFENLPSKVTDLLCFSHLRWNFVYQRPQHLLNRASRKWRTWFWEEPIWDDHNWLEVRSVANQLCVVIPHLQHGTSEDAAVAQQREWLDQFLSQHAIADYVAWYYNPMAWAFTDHLQPRLTVYDCMDELSAFRGAPPRLRNRESQLMQRANLVFTGGYSLFEAKRALHPAVYAFPSSIDYQHFSQARQGLSDPADQQPIAQPRIGFAGVIDERFDVDLVSTVAARRPDWQFVLIGPVVKIDRAIPAAVAQQREWLDQFLSQHAIADYVAWYYNPMAWAFTDHLQPRLTIYDCMDELSAFRGAPPRLRNRESQLMQRANLVFTGGYSLFEAKRALHPAVYAFPSSIDYQHFSQARQGLSDPADQQSIAQPRIGFAGVIDERFDVDLVSTVAARRPNWQFVLIGPVVKIDPAILPQGPNVHYLHMKQYTELPTYFSNWQVAMLPFALNESTRFISPTKTPEYLAAGLPVVSTPIQDVVKTYGRYDPVWIADSADAFEKAIEEALTGRDSLEWSGIDTFLNHHSWERTWSAMQELIEGKLQLASARSVSMGN